MSAGFTPGPWLAQVTDDEGSDLIAVGQPSPGDVLEGVLTRSSDAENEANANLIAAAPELYAALDELLHNGTKQTHVLVEQAEQALAKARGEQVRP